MRYGVHCIPQAHEKLKVGIHQCVVVFDDAQMDDIDEGFGRCMARRIGQHHIGGVLACAVRQTRDVEICMDTESGPFVLLGAHRHKATGSVDDAADNGQPQAQAVVLWS